MTMGLTVALYVFAFAIKLTGYFLTGVVAILADALHSLADIFVYVFLLLATLWSRREADSVHMFGYGRAQNAGALVAATLFIAFTSYKLFEEAVPRLFRPEAAVYGDLNLALVFVGVSLLIPVVPLIRWLAQKGRGAAARAQVMELVNDELSTLAALAGTLFIRIGVPLADPLAAVLVATLIAYNGVRLFREHFCFLVGKSPGGEFLREVEAIALSVDGVQGVHELRAELIGQDTAYAAMHVEVPAATPVEEADRIAREVHSRVQQIKSCRYCTIHVDPPSSAR
jgi:ferrous-iron efflux pump FieF